MLHFLLKEFISRFLQHFKVKQNFTPIRLVFWSLETYFWTRVSIVVIGVVETSWGQQTLPKSGKDGFTISAWSERQRALVPPYSRWTTDAESLPLDKWLDSCSTAHVPPHWIGMEVKSKLAWCCGPVSRFEHPASMYTMLQVLDAGSRYLLCSELLSGLDNKTFKMFKSNLNIWQI